MNFQPLDFPAKFQTQSRVVFTAFGYFN